MKSIQDNMTAVEPKIMALWREKVLNSLAHKRQCSGEEEHYWKHHAGDYQRNRTSGAHFHHVATWLSRTISHDASVLEIGPGPAIFTGWLAARCRHLTVVEPSPALAEWIADALREYTNLNIVRERWEDASIPVHDFVFCAGTLHLFTDIRCALEKMVRHARSKVLLVLLDDNRALQREAAGALHLNMFFPVRSLTSLFNEVLECLGLSFTWKSFTEEQTYRYPNIEVLINLWKEGLNIGSERRDDLQAFFKNKGLCNGTGDQVTVPRCFTSHLVEISV